MWTLLLVALAATPEELAAELPDARAQLAACAAAGCDRADGARAAWIVALGTYTETGVADGVAAATVRELDPSLFHDLPDALRAFAGEPPSWSTRVGGASRPAPPAPPTAQTSVVRQAAVRAAAYAEAPRLFILDGSNPDSFADPKVAKDVRKRIARPNAQLYPAGDLCQQQALREAPTLDPNADYEPEGQLSFERAGSFDTRQQARDYLLAIGGTEFLVTSGTGLLPRPPGDHQIWLVRESGVGPVLAAEEIPSPIRFVRDEADTCIADAWRSGPEGLAPHFRALAERLPGAPLYAVDVSEGRAKDAPMWRWQDGTLAEIAPR